tara:strand:+ start:1830 stop:2243 length:414 start_codon:yes stop_codon:yes gene_type:complete
MVNETTEKICKHHWMVDEPAGPFSIGQCKKCGEYDAFKNSDATSFQWAGHRAEIQIKYETHEEAKEAFLENHLSKIRNEIIVKPSTNTASIKKYSLEYRKYMAKMAVNSDNLTKVANNHNIPRRTLRNWVEKYEQMD